MSSGGEWLNGVGACVMREKVIRLGLELMLGNWGIVVRYRILWFCFVFVHSQLFIYLLFPFVIPFYTFQMSDILYKYMFVS